MTNWFLNIIEGVSVTITIPAVFLGPDLNLMAFGTHTGPMLQGKRKALRLAMPPRTPPEVHWENEGTSPDSGLPAPPPTRCYRVMVGQAAWLSANLQSCPSFQLQPPVYAASPALQPEPRHPEAAGGGSQSSRSSQHSGHHPGHEQAGP